MIYLIFGDAFGNEEAVRAVTEMGEGVHESGDAESLESLQAGHRRANANLLK